MTQRVKQHHTIKCCAVQGPLAVVGSAAGGGRRRRAVVGTRGDVGPPEVHARRRCVRAVRYREVDADALAVQLALVRLAARLPHCILNIAHYMHTRTAILSLKCNYDYT